jgi:hypothetical protein
MLYLFQHCFTIILSCTDTLSIKQLLKQFQKKLWKTCISCGQTVSSYGRFAHRDSKMLKPML